MNDFVEQTKKAPALGRGLLNHFVNDYLLENWGARRAALRPYFSFFGGVSLFSPGRSLRSRYLGFGFRQSSGNVPDEWVCSFQGAMRP